MQNQKTLPDPAAAVTERFGIEHIAVVDRDASFAPRLVLRRQTRLAALDDRVPDSTAAACRLGLSPAI